MNVHEALQERERLEGELANIRGAKVHRRERQQQIERELKQAGDEMRERRRAAAKSGKPRDVSDLEERERDLRAEAEQLRSETRAANEAQKEVEKSIRQLHFDHFGAFAENAEQLTGEALDRLEDLRELYALAVEAWNAAEAEWRRISRDHNQGWLAQRTRIDGPTDPEIKARQLSDPPSCPLPKPIEVFSGKAPRPAEIEPKAEVEPEAA